MAIWRENCALVRFPRCGIGSLFYPLICYRAPDSMQQRAKHGNNVCKGAKMQSAQLRQIGTTSGSGARNGRKERYATHRKVLKGITHRHVPCGASERIRSAAQQTFHGPEQQALIRRRPHSPLVHWRCEVCLLITTLRGRCVHRGR